MITRLLLLSYFFVLIQSDACVRNLTYVGRLPTSIIPSHYEIDLELPSPESSAVTFTGRVTININVMQPTSCIMLSSAGLQFDASNVGLTLSDGIVRTPFSVGFDDKSQMASISFSETLQSGQSAVLKIQYQGQINEFTAGFFRSANSYTPPKMDVEMGRNALEQFSKHSARSHHDPSQQSTDDLRVLPQNGNRTMFATQCESVGARRIFPGWDEPAFKATFKSIVTAPNEDGLMILSNAPEQSISIKDGKKTVEFQKTKIRMSTYLVAYAVGVFDYLSADQDGVRYRIFTPPGQSKTAAFALNVTLNIVRYFDKFFGFKYSELNSKMDQISVPAFADAMENQGLLTYWPYFLLAPEGASQAQLEAIALVVIHEISHQWYGDTVTCPWWTQTYLQEGFARFFQYTGAQALFPEWFVFSEYQLSTGLALSFFDWSYKTAMNLDFRGISGPALTLDQNLTIISSMYYEKGACINRMIERHVGTANWSRALTREVNVHKFTNPGIYDLMDSFQVEGMPDLQYKWMPWLLQPGFPVVQVEKIGSKLKLSQIPMNPFDNGLYQWWIPYQVKISDNSGNSQILDLDLDLDPQVEFNLKDSTWTVEGNFNYTSFVTTNYMSWELWEDVFNLTPNMTGLQRKLLIQNVFMLTLTAHVEIEVPMGISSTLSKVLTSQTSTTEDLLAIQSLGNFWLQVLPIISSSSKYSQLEKKLVDIVQPFVDKVGWNFGENSYLNAARTSILWTSAYLQNPETKKRALGIFREMGVATSADIQLPVFWSVASGDATQWELIRTAIATKSPDAPTMTNLMVALMAAPSTPAICISAIDWNANRNASTSDKIVQLGNAITYSTMCRSAALTSLYAIANASLMRGETQLVPTILSALNGASSISDIATVDSYLKEWSKFITTSQSQSVLTRVLQNQNVFAKFETKNF